MKRPVDDLVVTSENLPATLLNVGALGGLCVAAWLTFVRFAVLPERGPELIPLWTGVAVGYAVFGSAGLWLGARPRLTALRWVLGLFSPVAIVLGGLIIAWTWQRAGAGGDFEGYLVLMGAWLAAQGVAVLVFLWSTRRRADPLSARASG